jgi:hypothetical protein
VDQSSEAHRNEDGHAEPDELDKADDVEASRASSACIGERPTFQATEGERDR